MFKTLLIVSSLAGSSLSVFAAETIVPAPAGVGLEERVKRLEEAVRTLQLQIGGTAGAASATNKTTESEEAKVDVCATQKAEKWYCQVRGHLHFYKETGADCEATRKKVVDQCLKRYSKNTCGTVSCEPET